ncbi:MAG TPA: IclR family transcriptional regulator [Trebonia sp.]|jgi:DNA-binding IclR family transcriptional regulator
MANDVPSEPTAGGDRLTSVDNALWLLQLVAERQALRVSEAADLLGVARSTAHRLLSALRRRDFLMQDKPNGVYRPGPALHAIGMAAISRIDIRRIAQPVLEQLRDQTRETSSLAILEGTMSRFIECCEGLSAVRVGSRTGIVRYAHASAIGKAMLAALPDAELNRRYRDEELPAATPSSITSRHHLMLELASVRRQGYALNWEESSDGVSAVAVAVLDAAGAPLAAVSVAMPSMRAGNITGIRALAPDVLRAAEVIQQQLRGPNWPGQPGLGKNRAAREAL